MTGLSVLNFLNARRALDRHLERTAALCALDAKMEASLAAGRVIEMKDSPQTMLQTVCSAQTRSVCAPVAVGAKLRRTVSTRQPLLAPCHSVDCLATQRQGWCWRPSWLAECGCCVASSRLQFHGHHPTRRSIRLYTKSLQPNAVQSGVFVFLVL
jgi:hypothetical protein